MTTKVKAAPREAASNPRPALARLEELKLTLPQAGAALAAFLREADAATAELTEQIASIETSTADKIAALDRANGEEIRRLTEQAAEKSARSREIQSKFGFVIGTVTAKTG